MKRCEHNDHTHHLIWFCLAWVLFDCGGSERRLENKIRDLESKVHQLEGRR